MKIINKILLLAVAFCFTGCDDIFEEDISGDTVVMIYPQYQTVVESNIVNFQWQELDGADDYRLQVYGGNQIVADTLVSTAYFSVPVPPGSYQWRLRGENSAYNTNYSFPVSFSVVASEDLTNQQVLLSSPSANIYMQNTQPTFTWNTLNNATSYNFSLINLTNGNSIITEVPDINDTSYTLPENIITQDGHYQWRIKALNEENETETAYATRNFYIDTTPPNQSQNVEPENEATFETDIEVDFEWNIPQDSGIITSPLVYTIQIATDTSFTNIIQTGSNIATNSYSYTFTTEDTYYWRVKSTDAAGNQSTYSSYFKIMVYE
ncbi:hypothetical protein [Flavobacterium rhizosphaerae]|uniref:Fibronectin type-III domain-containing protein n=1 Tax=Flavobacterium rhizosphaerae TaxID=3163298 RepID=A0ABW8YVJ8_9FLAO